MEEAWTDGDTDKKEVKRENNQMYHNYTAKEQMLEEFVNTKQHSYYQV